MYRPVLFITENWGCFSFSFNDLGGRADASNIFLSNFGTAGKHMICPFCCTDNIRSDALKFIRSQNRSN